MDLSHPDPDVHQVIVEFADHGRAMAVALIVQTEGSAPCQAGAKAVVDAGGGIQGTIGGGLVEAKAQRLAVDAIRTGRPVVFDLDLQGATPAGSGPICGGRVRGLIDPTAAQHRAAYAAAAAVRQRRERGLLLTALRGSPEPLVTVQFLAEPALLPEPGFPSPADLNAVLQREQPELWVPEAHPPHPRLEILVEPLLPKPLLVIVGGGHIGQAVAVQAHLVGFEIVVIDDRPEFTKAERFPEKVTVRCGPIGEEVGNFPIDAQTYLVIATRSHQHDAQALAACLHRPAAYIGMIGSRRKVTLLRQDCVAAGWATAADFARLHAPIGLDIGARSVPEIATSIVAQLIAVRRCGAHAGAPSAGGRP